MTGVSRRVVCCILISLTHISEFTRCDEDYFYYEPRTTLLPCRPYCPPYVSDDRSIEFCRRNCPEYFSGLLQRFEYDGTSTGALFATSPGSVISPTPAPCDVTYFHHLRYGIVACSHICRTPPNDFCAANCPKYCSCLMKKQVLRDVIASSSSNSSGGGGDIKGDAESSLKVTPPSEFDVADLHRTTSIDVQATSQDESGRDCSLFPTVVIALVVVAVCALMLFVLYRVLSSCRSSNAAKQPVAGQGDIERQPTMTNDQLQQPVVVDEQTAELESTTSLCVIRDNVTARRSEQSLHESSVTESKSLLGGQSLELLDLRPDPPSQ